MSARTVAGPGAASASVGDAWRPRVVEALTGEEIEALLARQVAFVHVPRFLEPAWCAEIVRRFDATIATLPDHQGQRMGPALFDTLVRPVEFFVDSGDTDSYFAAAAQDAPRVRAVFEGGDDPLEKMRDAWRGAGWREVVAAEDEQRRYLPDGMWGLRDAAASPHVDAYEHDRQIALSRFTRHFNYNVYIQNADSGGSFIVYDDLGGHDRPRRLEPAQVAQLQRNTACVEHCPTPGDLVIFDAMYYHEVTQVHGAEKARIQVHSNMLIDPDTREFSLFV